MSVGAMCQRQDEAVEHSAHSKQGEEPPTKDARGKGKLLRTEETREVR